MASIEVNQKIFAEIVNQLNPEQIQNLQNLFDSNTSVERSPYHDLKKLPHRPSRNHLNDLIAHLTWLETLGEISPLLQNLTRSKIKHFTAEAKALTASEMKDIKLPKRLTLLLCLIYSAQVQTRDYLHKNWRSRTSIIGSEVDLSFASQQWQKMVLVKTENVTKVMRRHFEVCIFSYLAAELKSGDIYVQGSEAYADYRKQLLSWSDCQPYCQQY